MKSVQIIVGSMLGGTEYVAEACEEALSALDYTSTLHLTPDLNEITSKNQIWLVCTSTHGAGDYPDNFQQFVDQLTETMQDLTHTHFITIGLGDSNYDTFCHAAININKLLISKGCTEIHEPLLLDMSQDIDPEEAASEWITAQFDQLS